MPEPGQLKGVDEMDTLVQEVGRLVGSRGAGGQICEKWRVFLQAGVTQVAYREWIYLPVVQKQLALRGVCRVQPAMPGKVENCALLHMREYILLVTRGRG